MGLIGEFALSKGFQMEQRNEEKMVVRGRVKLNFSRSDRDDGPLLFTDLKARRSNLY